MNKTASLKELGLLAALVIFLLPSCSPEAPWTTSNVKINLSVQTVSAGFVECDFTPDKDAYYLIAIETARKDYDPMQHQKQFMTLALDSAYAEYLIWRNELLRKGEFNIAPFASHGLQYGKMEHFFTSLVPNEDYWIYAFVVNPQTMKPEGQLFMTTVHTTDTSIVDVHFAYRVKGYWDYTYPLDSLGNIYPRFPYLATTCDSLTLAAAGETDPVYYFYLWTLDQFLNPKDANVFYGVHAVENDGWSSIEAFEEGHTYYTAIAGFDGLFEHLTVYRFVWTGDSCNLYFTDTDPANIAYSLLDE
jgi:hypothetical protein